MPFPHILQTMITTTERAASHQFSEALVTALGARIRPMRMMIGPVTTGGKKRITRLIPTNFTTAAIIRYKRPATTIPPQA